MTDGESCIPNGVDQSPTCGGLEDQHFAREEADAFDDRAIVVEDEGRDGLGRASNSVDGASPPFTQRGWLEHELELRLQSPVLDARVRPDKPATSPVIARSIPRRRPRPRRLLLHGRLQLVPERARGRPHVDLVHPERAGVQQVVIVFARLDFSAKPRRG